MGHRRLLHKSRIMCGTEPGKCGELASIGSGANNRNSPHSIKWTAVDVCCLTVVTPILAYVHWCT